MLKLSYPILAKDFDLVKDCILDEVLTSCKDTLQVLHYIMAMKIRFALLSSLHSLIS
jgi:hypothetical protein